MLRKMTVTLFFLSILGASGESFAGEHGQWAWLKSYYQAYRDPANYPGRTVYPGSRYGFYGYVRPVPSTDPVPRSMRKTAPPTMYHWSKSVRAETSSASHTNLQADPYSSSQALPESGVYDYWAE